MPSIIYVYIILFSGGNRKMKKAVFKTLATVLTIAASTLVFAETAPKIAGMDLVFDDEFDGNKLDTNNWSYQNWEPGTVNAEWQKYTDSQDNVYVKNGILTIQALQGKKGDRYKYTSGRLIGYGKKEFKYGRFEARIKVPKGKGFLPAFWLMGNESIYGQWPRCGEVDIMEVMGHQTNVLYTTTHFGTDSTNGHRQGQIVTNAGIDLSADFHTYAVDWIPGKMDFYLDGKLIHTEVKWHSAPGSTSDYYPYPAPFNKPMYMILNLAVGGSWVGYPDSTTKFDKNAQMQVDWVRVYQKTGGYAKMEAECKEPQVAYNPKRSEKGNIIHNGDFSQQESLANDGKEWVYLETLGGHGKAEIKNEVLTISTTAAGSVDYSVQIVQGEIPLQKGATYVYSFDAWADAPRQMSTAFKEIKNWIPFIQKTVNLTKTKQHFEWEFKPRENDDNARLEWNMGHFGSTATIYIDNVSLIKK